MPDEATETERLREAPADVDREEGEREATGRSSNSQDQGQAESDETENPADEEPAMNEFGKVKETASKAGDVASDAKRRLAGDRSKTHTILLPLIAGAAAGLTTYAARRAPDFVRSLSRRVQRRDLQNIAARARDAEIVGTLMGRARDALEQAGGAREAVTGAARHVTDGGAKSTADGGGSRRRTGDSAEERAARRKRRDARRERTAS